MTYAEARTALALTALRGGDVKAARAAVYTAAAQEIRDGVFEIRNMRDARLAERISPKAD